MIGEMADNAHLVTSGDRDSPTLVVRDDRGSPIVEIDLPDSVSEPSQADDELRAAGWTRSGNVPWTEANDGWVVPVERS